MADIPLDAGAIQGRGNAFDGRRKRRGVAVRVVRREVACRNRRPVAVNINDVAVEDLDRARRRHDRASIADTRENFDAVDAHDDTGGVTGLLRIEWQLEVLDEEVTSGGEIVTARKAVVDGSVGRDGDLVAGLGNSRRRESDGSGAGEDAHQHGKGVLKTEGKKGEESKKGEEGKKSKGKRKGKRKRKKSE